MNVLTAEQYRILEVPRQDWHKPSGLAIAFAHSLVVPAGVFVNTPLRLRPFQMKFIRAVYNAVDPTTRRRLVRQAVLSMARRNGKTLLAAVLLLLHLVGPFKKPHATIVSAATTRKQAGIVFRYVSYLIRANKLLRDRLHVVPTRSRVIHKDDGSVYEAIAAQAGSQFGEGLDFVIYDELSQARDRRLLDALETSLGSQVEPLMLIISTQAPSDVHPLSELIDYGEKVNRGEIDDPTFVCQLHTAPKDAKLTDEKAWKAANPGLGDYRDIAELRGKVARAIRLPSEEATVRVFYLNQRVHAHASLFTPSVYEQNAGTFDPQIFFDGRPVYGGLDLSARTDLTAGVFTCEADDGTFPLWPFAWTPKDTLAERSLRDRAPYDAWADQGFLLPVEGPVIDYDWVAFQLAEVCTRMNLVRLNYDRWRIEILRKALAQLGAVLPLFPFGQGYKDMSPAVEAIEALALAGRLRHADHPVMKWCFSNVVVTLDAAGGRKLDKAKAYGRIDVAVAAVMAVAGAKCAPEADIEIAAMIA